MNRTEYLLTCLSEECAEVAQRVSKSLRFGSAERQPGQEYTNAQRIGMELCDLLAVMKMLEEEEAVVMPPDLHRSILIKQRKVEEYMEYSRHCGVLD